MLRLVTTLFVLAMAAAAQNPGVEHFEKKIRPVLVEKCQGCHSSKSASPMGGFVVDSKEGLLRGGATGPAVVPGNADSSLLLRALSYEDAHIKMPPTGKLPEAVIEDFETWIAMGAPDPRGEAPVKPAAPAGVDFEKGRQWWSFQPVSEKPAPAVNDKDWPLRKIDFFLLQRMEKAGLQPSPPASPRTLIRRLYYDLTGLPPTYQEVEALAADPSPEAYAAAVERLLTSPAYGERWGRFWLDVARWAEDNPTSEATNPPYPHSWRYRDWVIEAINRDMPYDRFVKMQFAADLMPGFERKDLPALGYFGAGPIYHKDPRLSRDVIETLATDDWDERVDAVSRGILGLTVACARCHDHKFDPISAKDYHALAGVFASMLQVERPLTDMPRDEEIQLAYRLERRQRLSGALRNLGGESKNSPEYAQIRQSMTDEVEQLNREFKDFSLPVAHAVIDAGIWIDGSNPNVTVHDIRPGQPRDLPVFLRGNVANTGEAVPRRFLTVLSKGEPEPFRQGSGRLELAEAIFSEGAPLAARVMVNRVWGWHFGRPLVGTPSDFGTQGEPPTHPELLDDLAARFIANGWSLKWLHREILLSRAWRQSSRPNEVAMEKDPANRLVWRMNPRRLDFEAWRDSILAVTGALDRTMGGRSAPLLDFCNTRRTVYATISRGRLDPLLALYDFPEPTQHAPSREATTSPTQQLFVMNSEFFADQAALLADAVRNEPDTDRKIQALYRRIFAREPSVGELKAGRQFVVQEGSPTPELWKEYAQALLATNEFAFLE